VDRAGRAGRVPARRPRAAVGDAVAAGSHQHRRRRRAVPDRHQDGVSAARWRHLRVDGRPGRTLHRAVGDSRRRGSFRDGDAAADDPRAARPRSGMGLGAADRVAGHRGDPAGLYLAVQAAGRKHAGGAGARDGHAADRVGGANDFGRCRGLSESRLREGRIRMNDVHQPARPATVNAQIVPAGTLDVLSRDEIARLRDATSSGLHNLLRSCALAVLTSGAVQDSARATLEQYPDFDIQVLQQDRGVKLDLKNAPAQAFVDGKIIRGTNELLFAVMRDIVYESTKLESGEFNLEDSSGITHAVFDILRNARVLRARFDPNLVVCWGGHSISREEYDYSKAVGYQLGLRGMDICTGCGPGAMKGPMKGATIAHAKQRHYDNRYIGLTEPSIIAAESPNPIVNSLVILPDIE